MRVVEEQEGEEVVDYVEEEEEEEEEILYDFAQVLEDEVGVQATQGRNMEEEEE